VKKMKLDVEVWLRPEDLGREDVVVTFVSEGEVGVYVEADGSERPNFDIGVTLPGGEPRRWTMNKTSQRAVASRLGADTKDWVGKSARVFAIEQNINGKLRKVIYARTQNT